MVDLAMFTTNIDKILWWEFFPSFATFKLYWNKFYICFNPPSKFFFEQNPPPPHGDRCPHDKKLKMKPCKNQGAYLSFAAPWMMTYTCAFNMIAILINQILEALRNKNGTNNILFSDVLIC